MKKQNEEGGYGGAKIPQKKISEEPPAPLLTMMVHPLPDKDEAGTPYRITGNGSNNDLKVACINENDRGKSNPLLRKLVYIREKGLDNYLQLDSGTLEPLRAQDSVLYVVGVRGSGKSTFTSNYALNYNMLTGNGIVLVSVIDEDESMILPKRHIKIQPHELSESLEEAIVNGKNYRDIFANKLIIFDDIFDGKATKKDKILIHNFIKDICENGRHDNIDIIITSHVFCNGMETKSILNDCTGFVIMLDSPNMKGINYMLETYCGFSRKTIRDIMREYGEHHRWLYYNRKSPNYLMTNKSLRLFNPVKAYIGGDSAPPKPPKKN